MSLRIAPCEIGPAAKVICHITHIDGTTEDQEVEITDFERGEVELPDNTKAGDKLSFTIHWLDNA
jgi:hypothetical protein